MKISIYTTALLSFLLTITVSCDEFLHPKPVDRIVNEIVLNSADDVPNVEIGLYSAFRSITSSVVIAGDLTSDNLIHNGTFSEYRELGVKRITSANATVAGLWQSVYGAVYVANFVLERLPQVPGVKPSEANRVLATAHFLRGLAYFIAYYTFGPVPLTTTTDIASNQTIPRASSDDILTLILDDYTAASGQLPTSVSSPAYASEYAVRAALARFYLYANDWTKAEQFSSDVINSRLYALDSTFSNIVLKDFTSEAIFEMGYTINDDPGTLNTLFVGRREIIPSNQEVVALASAESGDRFSSISFDLSKLGGTDNGWNVSKYGTAVEDNNNIVVFRLAEMYLIRAEARANLGKVTGTASAQEDLNVLRDRANAPAIASVSQDQMLLLIENERRYELAFEGHRWYDLVRTGRAHTVMTAFSSEWKDTYNLWPIPQHEIQNNKDLVGHQNPGY